MGNCCRGLGPILVDFSGWTSAHGLPHIGSSSSKTLRIFWILVINAQGVIFKVTLVSACGFAYFLNSLITKYFSYPTSIQTTLKFEKSVFPAVTLCHLNPYSSTKLGTGNAPFPAAPTLKNNEALYKLARSEPYLDNSQILPTNDKQNLDDWQIPHSPTDEVDTQILPVVHAWSKFLIYHKKQENETEFEEIAYTYEDLFLSCIYNTAGCNESHFEKRFYPEYGNCFTFNADGAFSSTRAGPLYGMRLLMRLNQESYNPYTTAAGVRVSVHQARPKNTPALPDEPFPDSYGFNAAPGFATSFGVKFAKTIRLEPPHGQCQKDIGSLDYFYDGEFLAEGCFRSCLQKHIIEKCSCYDPSLGKPKSGTIKSCSDFSELSVIATQIAYMAEKMKCVQESHLTFNVLAECTCPQACDEGTYSTTVSAAAWPSQKFLPTDCFNNTLKKTYWQRNPGTGKSWTNVTGKDDFYNYLTAPDTDNDTCREWYAKNTLQIEVYFERMNYQVMTQEKNYGIIPFISDTGGQLGLFLGISFITCIEVFSMLAFICLYSVKSSSINKQNESGPRDSIDEWHDDKWMENQADEDRIQRPYISSDDSSDEGGIYGGGAMPPPAVID